MDEYNRVVRVVLSIEGSTFGIRNAVIVLDVVIPELNATAKKILGTDRTVMIE
jgi:hypothetical protein